MSSRRKDGARRLERPVRLSPHAELIRDKIAQRRERLMDLLPEAVELEARLCEVLHDRLGGRVAELALDEGERYSQYQLTGERGLRSETLCKYLVLATEDACAALDAALAPLGSRVALCDPPGGELLRANVDLMQAVAILQGAVSSALEDGVIDERERLGLRERARELRLLAEHLEGAC